MKPAATTKVPCPYCQRQIRVGVLFTPASDDNAYVVHVSLDEAPIRAHLAAHRPPPDGLPIAA